MSPATSDAQSASKQSSFLRVPATRYTSQNDYKFKNGSNLGFFWNQEDFEGPSEIISVRYAGIVSNTNIGDQPEIQTALITNGKETVRAALDGDLAAEWKKAEERTNERFRQMSGKIMHIAQQSELGPFREWKFDNGTDHTNLLKHRSVRTWTMQPPPHGRHSELSTSGKESAPNLASRIVIPREKNYVPTDSDDPDDTIPSPTRVTRGRQPTREGE